MAKIKPPYHGIIEKINRHHESKQSKPRPHFGLSQCGHHCERWLWLSFRWAIIEQFQGRILRLFRRGHMEEETIVKDLKAAGLVITNTGFHDQLNVKAGCNVSGSLDGVIHKGVHLAEDKKHVLEIKTHAKKSFEDLQKKGVQKSKPLHYWQMQAYMKLSDIDRALYVAVCKDNDELYVERVKLDEIQAQRKIDRCKRIAMEERMPPPVSTDPSWYQCRFCAAPEFCHKSHTTKEVNCRTCIHVTPLEAGGFRCERWGADIPVEAQRAGCKSHIIHPDLTTLNMVEMKDEWTAVFQNGSGSVSYDVGENGLSSAEFLKELVE